MTDHLAAAEIAIDASRDEVWTALTDPEQIKEYMFGSTTRSSTSSKSAKEEHRSR